MKLTKEQLDIIDNYLEKRNLDYLDFKIEIKDHLACEIESLMQYEKATFEEAFQIIQKGWQNHLADAKWSWMLNHKRTFPKIVFKKIRNRFILFYAFIPIYILLFFIFPKDIENFSNYISNNNDLKSSIFLMGLIILYGLVKLNILKKNKTSYSGFFNKISYSSISFIALSLIINNLFFIGVYFVLYSFPFLIYYYFKHQQFVKKYNLI